MDIVTLIMLVLGLSLDDFTVAIAVGLTQAANPTLNKAGFAFRVAIAFTIPTVTFTLAGWWVGVLLSGWLEVASAWIILGIFVGLGAWVINEAREGGDELHLQQRNLFSFWVLLVLGALTSLDEGAIGVTFTFLDISIPVFFAVLVGVNVLLGVGGVVAGMASTKMNQKWVQILAGLLLIGIGVKNWMVIWF